MSKTPWTSFGSTVRVEPGPRRVTAKATRELMDDGVTASHYHLPRQIKMRDDDGKLVDAVQVSRDALGKEINEGDEITYLDWLGHADPENKEGTVYYLYHLRNEPQVDASGNAMRDARGHPLTVERWVEVGVHDSEEAAHKAANKLAGKE